MTHKIRCVLLGLGNQAKEHLSAAINHNDVEIIAGIDPNPVQQASITAEFPTLELIMFSSLDNCIASGLDFDAFILALPHHVYEKNWTAITALHKPLLKEKPLGRNLYEARTFMHIAEQQQCGLMTAIQRREHASYQFLVHYIQTNNIKIDEIHAHLHLGKGSVFEEQANNLLWRGNKTQAGGGALLDAGYHLIDLIQYIIGDFDVISATMWNGSHADNGLDIEDRSWLMGRSSNTWLMLDTWVKGKENGQGGFIKSEQVLLHSQEGIIRANREGVWLNTEQIFQTTREWDAAMRQQLSHFAQCIQHNDWSSQVIWDQLPAMRKIEEAYHLSAQY